MTRRFLRAFITSALAASFPIALSHAQQPTQPSTPQPQRPNAPNPATPGERTPTPPETPPRPQTPPQPAQQQTGSALFVANAY